MAKHSIKGAVRTALADEKRASRQVKLLPDGTQTSGVTMDSFVNFQNRLGVGADNILSSSGYSFNPLTRNRVQLEWMHRGSWLAGQVVDVVGDDMTRAGTEPFSDVPPQVNETMERAMTGLRIWDHINETVRWARLYGGCLAVALIDGQDPRTPLNLNAIGPGQFKGLLVLDRWMVEPSLEDLVTDLGPSLGLPKYYRVSQSAPALRGAAIHHSRVMLRLEGAQLPYQQRLTENLWGASVLERLNDRMIAFDLASTGAAQLVNKSYLRTLKMKDFRSIVAAGGKVLEGVVKYVEMMRRMQGIEGVTLIDGEDEFEVQEHGAFGGLSDILNKFGEQLSGATQIPLVRLFGQSPAGLNATGESDMRMYYDHIKQQQQKTLFTGVNTITKVIAKSMNVPLPSHLHVAFRNLWQLTDVEKADIAGKVGDTVGKAMDSGIIGRRTALKELRQSSRVTGVFANVDDETINAADDEVAPPELEMPELPGLPGIGGNGVPGGPPGPPGLKGKTNEDEQPRAVPDGTRRRVQLQKPAAPGGQADRRPGEGPGNVRPQQPRPVAANPQGVRRPANPVGK